MTKEKEIKLKVSKEEKEMLAKEEEILARCEKVKKREGLKKVFYIEVQDEDNEEEWIGAIFRKPKLKEFSYFTTLAQKGDKVFALQDLMKKIFVEGDSRIIEDDDYFLSAMTQVEEIINVQASRIKKY